MVVKNYLALAYRRAGEYEQEESLFNELLQELSERSQLLPWCRFNLAHVYYGQGRYQEAGRLLLDPVEGSFENVEKTRNRLRDWYAVELAKVYQEQGRYEESEKEYIRAIEIQKKDKVWGALRGMSGLAGLYVE